MFVSLATASTTHTFRGGERAAGVGNKGGMGGGEVYVYIYNERGGNRKHTLQQKKRGAVQTVGTLWSMLLSNCVYAANRH